MTRTHHVARILFGCALALSLALPLTVVAEAQSKTAPAGRVFQIAIERATFEDAPSGIKAGDTIEWVNKDPFDHTSTARSGLWDVVIPAGKKARVVVKKTGTFEYYCKLHPNMAGTIVVK